MWALLVVCGVACVVTARSVYDGERALSACDDALRAKDRPTATARAREAATWYVPGAPHVPAAYARLVHIARTSEAEGDRESALLAWRAVRTAIVDSGFAIRTHEAELAAANRAILRLSAPEPGTTLIAPDDQAALDRRLETLLARRERARGPYVGLLFASLVVVLGSAVALLRLDAVKMTRSLALVGVAVGFVAYAVAVWLA